MSSNTPKYMRQLAFLLVSISLLSLSSCTKEYESIQQIDEAKIQAYIKQNNLTMTKDASGFYYKALDAGSGETMLNKDSVFFTSKVYSLSGNVYYDGATIESNYLGYLNDTFRTAFSSVKRGGKVLVIQPSYLAYGRNGNAVIPPNEVIVTEFTIFPETKQWELDDRLIKEFLAKNNLTAIKHPSRGYYIVQQAGSGTAVQSTSIITVNYEGRYLDGTVFDKSTEGSPYTDELSALIQGWRKMLIGMQKGAKLRLLIPSDLAYGQGSGSIPANSILDFDIELVDVVD